jgi:hypothetical protein
MNIVSNSGTINKNKSELADSKKNEENTSQENGYKENSYHIINKIEIIYKYY